MSTIQTIKWVSVILLAVAIAALGEMTRSYSAFGGEDVLALALIGYVIHNVRKEVEDD